MISHNGLHAQMMDRAVLMPEDATEPVLLRSLERPGGIDYEIDVQLSPHGMATSAAGVHVDEETGLQHAPVWRACELISGDVSKLSCGVFTRDSRGGLEPATSQPAHRVLCVRPNAAMTCGQFRRYLVFSALWLGNGYALIKRDLRTAALALELLDARFVTPYRAGRPEGELEKSYDYNPPHLGGRSMTFADRDVIHISGLPALSEVGIKGYNTVWKARESLGLSIGAEKFASYYFRNAARPSVVLQCPEHLDEPAAKRLADTWSQYQSGLHNQHKTAVLEKGITANVLSLSPADSQLMDLRRHQVRDVALWFGVPPHKLGDDSRTAFNSLEQENQSYLQDTLDGWLHRLEDEFEAKLISEAARGRVVILFDRNALVRVDYKTRWETGIKAVQAGVQTPNEFRVKEGMPPIAGGDDLLRPMNMSPAAGVPDAEPEEEEEDDDVETEDDEAQRHVHELQVAAVGGMVRRVLRDCERRQGEGYASWLETEMEPRHRGVIRGAMVPVANSCHVALDDGLDAFFGVLRSFASSLPSTRFAEAAARSETEICEKIITAMRGAYKYATKVNVSKECLADQIVDMAEPMRTAAREAKERGVII